MPDTALRHRHRLEPWREKLIAAIALLREAQARDHRVLARASRLGALAQAQVPPTWPLGQRDRLSQDLP